MSVVQHHVNIVQLVLCKRVSCVCWPCTGVYVKASVNFSISTKHDVCRVCVVDILPLQKAMELLKDADRKGSSHFNGKVSEEFIW